MSTQRIRKVLESPDGVIATFTTPEPYAAGSLRAIRNSLTYEPDDTVNGWTEISPVQFTFVTAPESGDVIAVYYTERRSNGTFQDPAGILP